MSVPLGGIEAYLNQLQYGNAGQAARNLHQQGRTESAAVEAAGGVSPKADRTDGFSPIKAGETATTNLRQREPIAQEETRSDLLDLIKERLQRGEHLSDSDMRYLRNHDPGLYQKAKQVSDIRQKFSEILARAPRGEGGKIYREVLAQAQKAQASGDAEIGQLLAKAVEKEFADFRGGKAEKTGK